MEKITFDLKISEFKERSLCKAYEELHSQASSILVFSLQWKDLENHFRSTRMSLQSGMEELLERENDIKSREKLLLAKESQLSSKLESQEALLVDIQKLIGESLNELESKQQHVASLKSLIEEAQEELAIKEKRHGEIQKWIAEKDREFDRVNSSVKEREEKLELLEKRVKQKSVEVESKETELETVRRSLRGYNRKYIAIQKSVEERKREVELKEEELRMRQISINDCDKEIKLKEEELDIIQNSLVKCSKELELKEKQLDLVRKDVDLKEQNLVSLKELMDQCARNFEMNEKGIDGFLKKLESTEKFFESKFMELDLFEHNVSECLKEVELREKNLDSLQKSIEERSHKLEKRVNEFNVKRKEFKNSSQKPTESTRKENTITLHSQLKVEQSEYTHINDAINHQYSIPREGKALQLLLNGHLKRHDSLCREIFAIIKASSDPAKLVLDAMQGFYSPHSSSEDREFDLNIVRRSCILLLEQLKEASPQISPQVREEALKLLSGWKAKMMVENLNYLEALGFLQFLVSYGLTSAFDANELDSVFDAVGLQGQASELRQALRPTDKPFVEVEPAENLLADVVTSSLNLHTLPNTVLQQSPDPAKLVLDSIQVSFSQHWEKGDVDFERSGMSNCIIVFEELFRILPQIQPLVKKDAMKLAIEWKAKMRATTGNSLEVLGFLQFLATYGLISSFDEDELVKFVETISQHKQTLENCRTLGFAEKIPEFIQNLIRRNKLIDAVRLICAFKLTDEISPVPLLTQYVENLKKSTTEKLCKGKKPIEEKEKFTDDEIEALGDVIQCVKTHKLESEFPLSKIEERINLLEKINKHIGRSALLHSIKVPKAEQHREQPPPPRKKRRNNAFARPSGRNKFFRTSTASSFRHHCPPQHISVVHRQVQRELPPDLHEPVFHYDRDYSQFRLAENSNGPYFGAGVQLPY